MAINLHQASSAIDSIPPVEESIPELMRLADGVNPNIPGYMALGKLLQIKKLREHSQQSQMPQGTIKDNIERAMSTVDMMGDRRKQMEQAAMMGGIHQAGPVPEGVPQPQHIPQPEEDMSQQVMAAASGGIMHASIPEDTFSFAPGGIVAFAGKDDKQLVKDKENKNFIERAIEQLAKETLYGGSSDESAPSPQERQAAALAEVNKPSPDQSMHLPPRPAMQGHPLLLGATPLAETVPSAVAAPQPAPQPAPQATPPFPAGQNMQRGPLPGGGITVGTSSAGNPIGDPATQATQVATMAKSMLPDNKYLAASENAIGPAPAALTQEQATERQLALNKALGIGTYGENRRKQLAELRGEFEKNQPTTSDRFIGMASAYAKPGALPGSMGTAHLAMSADERKARMEFAKSENEMRDAIEKADEAVRIGNAGDIRKTVADREKAITDFNIKKSEVLAHLGGTLGQAQSSALQGASSIMHADITAMGQVNAAKVHAAATLAGFNKPSEVERAMQQANEIWIAAEKAKPGSGDAAVEKFRTDRAAIAASVLGSPKIEGQDRSSQNNKAKLDHITKVLIESMIDSKIQRAKNPQEKAKLLEDRKDLITRASADADKIYGGIGSLDTGATGAPVTSTNPQTGEKLVLSPDGKSWIPAR